MLLLIAICPLHRAGAQTEEPEPALTFDLASDFVSDYIFRGQNLFDGTSIQPSASLSYSFGDYGTASAATWAHLSAEGGQSASEKFTEVDYTLSYSVDLDLLSLGAGVIFYTFPRGDDGIANTEEAFVSVGLDLPLAPTLTYYRDYDEFDLNYFALGFSEELAWPLLGEGFGITPAVVFGFATDADKAYEKDSGLMHVTAGLSTDFAWGDYLTVTPYVSYNFEVDDTTDNELVVGFRLGSSS